MLINPKKLKNFYLWSFPPILVYLAICGLFSISGFDWFRPIVAISITGITIFIYLIKDQI